MPTPLPATIRPETDVPPVRAFRWLRTGIVVIVFCALLAVLIAPLNAPGEFWAGFVHSECIGLGIYGLYRVLDWVLPLRRLPDVWSWSASLITVPLGYAVGTSIASALLGEPQPGFRLLHMPWFDIGLTIAASAGIIYFIWSRERLHAETTAHARVQRLAAEAQLKLLQTQIEPHMLFNTLSTLHSLIEVDPARAQHMLDQLITYLRGTLSASRAYTITLRQEFDQLDAYLQLMQIRMGARLSYRLDLPAALYPVRIPPMLLQPLAENAIKHGLEPKIEGGSITVQARLQGGTLRLEVRDTGLGADTEPADQGYGLTHVRERLKAMYGERATLDIDTHVAGFAVRIAIHLLGAQS